MKSSAFIGVALLLTCSGSAMAVDCSQATQIGNTGTTTIRNTLGGKTVCAKHSSDSWQEYHLVGGLAGGVLVDYKMGANHSTDPSKQVGTWATSGTGANSVITYNYGPGQSYTYELHLSNGIYTFCGRNGAPNIDVIQLKVGLTSCGF